MRDVTMLAGAAGTGYVAGKGLVPSIGPVGPALVVGGVLGVLVPMFVKGRAGRISHDLGLGALCGAAFGMGASGTFSLQGDGPDLQGDGGGWT